MRSAILLLAISASLIFSNAAAQSFIATETALTNAEASVDSDEPLDKAPDLQELMVGVSGDGRFEHNVWFDTPYLYTTIGKVSGTDDIYECVAECANTAACIWAGRSDVTKMCELRAVSADISNFNLPSAVVVKSDSESYTDKSSFYYSFEEETIAVFPTAMDWCYLNSQHSINSMSDCKKMCEDKKACGRVSLNIESGECVMQQACGDLNSKYQGLHKIEPTGKYVDLPQEYRCKGSSTLLKTSEGITNLLDCKMDCDNTKHCTAVSLDMKTDTCYLHSSCSKYRSRRHTLTSVLSDGDYVKIPVGYNCYGPAVRSGIPDIKSLKLCMNECDAVADCGALTWNSEDKKCFLKESCNEYEFKNEFQNAAVKVSAPIPARAYADMPHGDGYGYRCKGVMLGKMMEGMNSVDECKRECDATAKCAALSYKTLKGKCQLYESCVRFNFSTNEITAVVMKNGEFVNVPNGYGCKSTSLERSISVSSMNQCKAECAGTDDCFAVTLNDETGLCFLKPRCDEYEKKEDNRSSRQT